MQERKSFENVKAWQLGREFKNKIYIILKNFSRDEIYCLVQQIRRAAISITANIAEGYGRYSFQENIQFCRISRGSTSEVLDHLYTALDQNYIAENKFNELYQEVKAIEKAINGYIMFLQGQK